MYFDDLQELVYDDISNAKNENGKKELNNNAIVLKRKINGKMKQIPIYPSKQQGTFIIDAITGTKQDYHVGSIEEELYFKISVSSGETGNESVTLFFHSPEEYEKHFDCELNPSIKEKWAKKSWDRRCQIKW